MNAQDNLFLVTQLVYFYCILLCFQVFVYVCMLYLGTDTKHSYVVTRWYEFLNYVFKFPNRMYRNLNIKGLRLKCSNPHEARYLT